MMSVDALEKMRAITPLDVAVILLGPGGTMVRDSSPASTLSPPASIVAEVPSGGRMTMYSSGLSSRSRTAPGCTSE